MSEKPITPKEAAKNKTVPEAVIEAFNLLIAENMSGNCAVVFQNDVVKLLEKKGYDRSEIFDKSYLDIENLYEAAGWKVVYDKPGYNETYSANFTFTKK